MKNISQTGQVGHFLTQSFPDPKFFGPKTLSTQISFVPKMCFYPDLLTQKCLEFIFFNAFWLKIFKNPNLSWTQNCFTQKKIQPTFFLDPTFFILNFLRTKYFRINETNLNLHTKMHLGMEFDSGIGPTCFTYIVICILVFCT